MIYTITLNPALDLELTVDKIRYDQVLRAKRVRVDCGGKGFNIARALAQWGEPSLALGLVGGKTGERLAEELQKLGVHAEFTWIAGETRINVAIVTTPPAEYIKVNQAGPNVTEDELEILIAKVRSLVNSGDLWLISGSLPPGAPADTYILIIQAVQAAGGRVMVDADGETLLQACRAKPYLVKPNALEASQLTGIDVRSPHNVREAAQFFHNLGVLLVLITLGEQGAVLSNGTQTWCAIPPQISIQSPIGAGDATLAGFVWGLTRGETLCEALRLSVASGTASASLPGTAMAERALVEEIARRVTLLEI